MVAFAVSYDGINFRPEIIICILVEPQPSMFLPTVPSFVIFYSGPSNFKMFIPMTATWTNVTFKKTERDTH